MKSDYEKSAKIEYLIISAERRGFGWACSLANNRILLYWPAICVHDSKEIISITTVFLEQQQVSLRANNSLEFQYIQP